MCATPDMRLQVSAKLHVSGFERAMTWFRHCIPLTSPCCCSQASAQHGRQGNRVLLNSMLKVETKSALQDCKPRNALFMLHSQTWRWIDFGCAAPSCAAMPAAGTMSYAAPEVVLARSAQRRICVHPSQVLHPGIAICHQQRYTLCFSSCMKLSCTGILCAALQRDCKQAHAPRCTSVLPHHAPGCGNSSHLPRNCRMCGAWQ